ncbi:MAG: hypothetical protein NT169_13995 [Chloroflexi bacterium]|nr:hypothetical protein [Chloroflexota bacterium]
MDFVRQTDKRTSEQTKRLHRHQQPKQVAILVVAVLLLVLGSDSGLASSQTTITVDGIVCGLIDAINAVNTDALTGGCPAGSGADIIALQTDVSLVAVNNTTFGATGLPVVTSQVTIRGDGHTISRSTSAGIPKFRILAVAGGGELTLEGVTITNGRTQEFGADPEIYGGGVLVLSGGSLTLRNSTVSDNSAFAHGGGLSVFRGTVTTFDTIISRNSSYAGGGIWGEEATVFIQDGALRNNVAQNHGGGISLLNGSTTVLRSTLSGNSATETGGGAIFSNGSKLIVADSAIFDNSASSYGGGIANWYSTGTISNCTVYRNSAAAGGGVVNLHGELTLFATTISTNEASKGGGIHNEEEANTRISSSILAFQTAGGDCSNADLITSGGYNLASDLSCELAAAGDQQSVTPDLLILRPLADNGGSTQTMALGRGSIAIDRIPNSVNGCGADFITDQRGQPRPLDGNGDGLMACDAGAYEAPAQALPTPTPSPAEIPEPLTLVLVGSGLAGLAGYRWWKFRALSK